MALVGFDSSTHLCVLLLVDLFFADFSSSFYGTKRTLKRSRQRSLRNRKSDVSRKKSNALGFISGIAISFARRLRVERRTFTLSLSLSSSSSIYLAVYERSNRASMKIDDRNRRVSRRLFVTRRQLHFRYYFRGRRRIQYQPILPRSNERVSSLSSPCERTPRKKTRSTGRSSLFRAISDRFVDAR